MDGFIVWKDDISLIKFFDNKYSIITDNKESKKYESITPCSNGFFIACLEMQYKLKYLLLDRNGNKIFEKKYFDLISYDDKNRSYSFYEYFNKVSLVIPKLTKGKEKIFYMLLSSLMDGSFEELDDLQTIINEINKKIENISEKDIPRILSNISMLNSIYVKLNKPSYLENCLLTISKDEEDNVVNIIYQHKEDILNDLIIKQILDRYGNKRVYTLNEKFLKENLFISDDEIVKDLNKMLDVIDSIEGKINKLFDSNENRIELFSSLKNINNYINNENALRFVSNEDYKLIKTNKVMFLNLIYNKNNRGLLEKLKEFSII